MKLKQPETGVNFEQAQLSRSSMMFVVWTQTVNQAQNRGQYNNHCSQ